MVIVEGNNAHKDKIMEPLIRGEMINRLNELRTEDYEFDLERKKNFENFFSSAMYEKYSEMENLKDLGLTPGYIAGIVRKVSDDLIEVTEFPIDTGPPVKDDPEDTYEEPVVVIKPVPLKPRIEPKLKPKVKKAPQIPPKPPMPSLKDTGTEKKRYYCLYWSRECAVEVTGGQRCRQMGCDVYAVEMVGTGGGKYYPEDFPEICDYSTTSKDKALLEAKHYREEKEKRQWEFIIDTDSRF